MKSKKWLFGIIALGSAACVSFTAALSLSIIGSKNANSKSSTNNNVFDFTNANDVMLTFDGNGGTLSGTNVVKTKSDVQFSSLTVPTATREGYTFKNWYYNDDVEVTSTTTFSANTTIKAKWESYTITFDSGEGKFSDSSTSKSITKNKIYSDEIEIPTCENKVFEGWYIDDTKQVFPYTATASKTLTAKYTNESVNVVVTANGGYFGDTTTDIYKVMKVNKGITWSELSARSDFPKTINNSAVNQIFSKWQLNGADISSTEAFTSTKVIKAKYEDAVTVTFDVASNSGEWSDASTTSKSAKIKLGESSSNPTLSEFKEALGISDTDTHSKTTNYALLGWFDDKDATNDAIENSYKFTTSGEHKVYAYYKVPFNLHYEGDTIGYEKTSAPSTFLRKDTVTIKLTQKTGYTLANTIKIYKGSYSTPFTDFTYSLSDGVGTITITDAPAADLYIVPTAPINTYTITITAETGKGTVTGSGTYNHGTSVTAKLTGTTDGYTFNGWYNGDTCVSTDSTYTFTATSSLTLTAKFDLTEYTITYMDGSSKITGLTPTSYNMETATFSLPTASKSNYVFAGWYTETTFQNNVTQIEKGTTGNKVYYASFISTSTRTEFSTCDISVIASAASSYESGVLSETNLLKLFKSGSTNITSLSQFVGLTRTVKVNGQYHTIRVIDTNHDTLATQPSGKTGVKALFTFEFANLISDSNGYSLGYYGYDGTEYSNTDWLNSSLRYALTGSGNNCGDGTKIFVAQKGATTWCTDTAYTNNKVIDMLPTELSGVLKTVKKSVRTGDSYVETEYTDKLFLLSGVELGVSSDTDKRGCGKVYSYYSGSTDSKRVKKQVDNSATYTDFIKIASGSGHKWNTVVYNQAGYNSGTGTTGGGDYWCASLYPEDSPYFKYVGEIGTGGAIDYNGLFQRMANAVAPAFCI